MDALISALADPRAWRDDMAPIEVIETHISWVLLAGDHAWKIKKPVVLPFVDFGTLAARKHYCEEELRLNRRLAPDIYLDVVPITGSTEAPRIEGNGTAIEYAVKMRRFEQDALFDHLLAHNALLPEHIDRLAERIADFHAHAPSTSDMACGAPDKVLQLALDNFADMATHADRARREALDALEQWTRDSFTRLEPTLAARHRDGKVRECHGDLHLRNIALIDEQPVAFDCIEFNAEFRWIDVINEAAFLVMDLIDRGRPDLGYRLFDRYLARTGDYPGVAVLRFYLVYRALVRAKVHDLRARQAHDEAHESARLQAAAGHYIALATDIAHGADPALLLMHGYSGAGKSRVAAALVETLGAIRLRSDVERKRLAGLDADARTASLVDGGIYTRAASQRTYAHLADLARKILDAGYPAIIDAAFLARAQREPMFELAHRLGVPLRIVDCAADTALLRERITARAARGTDASEATLAVLKQQLSSHEPLEASERDHTVRCDMSGTEAGDVASCVAAVVHDTTLLVPARWRYDQLDTY